MGRRKKIIDEPIPEVITQDVLVDGKFYKGNENLIRGKATFNWTPEMVAEFEKCRTNILHFAENYFYITTLDEGKQKIKLYKYQKKILKTVNNKRFTILALSRQSGKSTIMTIFALWYLCFNDDKRIAIVANKKETAEEVYSRIKMAFEMLPVYLKPGVKSWRDDGLELQNDSEIRIGGASASSLRGYTANIVILDEAAHFPPELMKELWKSTIPVITASKKSKLVIISTPNGTGNKFYELFLEAKKDDSEWALEQYDWTHVPGRDEEWKRQTMAALASERDFKQEYCNDFFANETQLIDAELLDELSKNCIEPILVNDDGAYRIYKQPHENGIYVIGVDVGEGIGRTNSVAQIFDVSDLTQIEQVAVFASNIIEPYHLGTRLMGVLEDWGRPPILIENNNHGKQVLDVLVNTHNYENIVTYKLDGFSKHYKSDHRYGIYNHTNTQYSGITNFRYWVNAIKVVKFYDLDTVNEICNFIRLPNYTFKKRKEDLLDDRVFGSIWGLFILDPKLAEKYFVVVDTDEQGKPLVIESMFDNKELIRKSPLFSGNISQFKKIKDLTNVPTLLIGQNPNQVDLLDREVQNFNMWLLQYDKDKKSDYPQIRTVETLPSQIIPDVLQQKQKEKEESFSSSFMPMIF